MASNMIGRIANRHVESGSEAFFRNFENPFAPPWSPYEGLNTSQISHWAAMVWPSRNVGDEIQTIAETGLYPPKANLKVVNREAMKSYNGPPVGGLINGWFLHKTESWPPSDSIRAAFIAFHAHPGWTIDSASIAYLRRAAPIGCRDMYTLGRLQELGIDAYFSGCLTLTLTNPVPSHERGRGGIVVVDYETSWHRRKQASATRLYEEKVPLQIRAAAISVDQIRRQSSRFVGGRRFDQAVAMLNLLARAKLVITKRLHTALPCLAMGVPFIFLNESFNKDQRFDGFRDYLQGVDWDTDRKDINWEGLAPLDSAELISVVRNAARRAAAHSLDMWNR